MSGQARGFWGGDVVGLSSTGAIDSSRKSRNGRERRLAEWAQVWTPGWWKYICRWSTGLPFRLADAALLKLQVHIFVVLEERKDGGEEAHAVRVIELTEDRVGADKPGGEGLRIALSGEGSLRLR